jgi:hypothetical protein
MLPRWHILYGGLFTLLIWFFSQNLNPIYLILVFLSSFLIDFDHYIVAVHRTKKYRLKHSFNYHKEAEKKFLKNKAKGIREKTDFHLFHTIEFHVLLALLGMIWIGFFYIFIGMFFHSLLDLFYMLYHDRFYAREFFFFNWARQKLFK